MVLSVCTRGFRCLWSIYVVVIMFCIIFLKNVLCFCVGFAIGLNV